MTTSDWQDVSYKHKSGVWERNLRTGEEREVKRPVILPKEAVVPLADHVVIKPKAAPKTKGWKNNAA